MIPDISPRAQALKDELERFMVERVLPAEREHDEHCAGPNRWDESPVLTRLKVEARERGLWNLFLPHDERGASSPTPRRY
jgi:acyl-CoA dehydrogenase